MELFVDNGCARSGLWRGALDGFLTERGATDHIVPAADVAEDGNGYHFYFEVPGLSSESIDVRVEDDQLVVEAERKRPEWTKETELHRSERLYGKIQRSFRLPEDANPEEIRAAYRDGVLEVTVGKRPETKPIRVKVEHEN
jgi:HSP20 family protein